MSVRKTISITVQALSFFFLFTAVSNAYVIDRIEAVVGDAVITKSEVDGAYASELRMRLPKGGTADANLRDEVLDSLIDRLLLLQEARKFNIVQVTDEEVNKALESLKKNFASDGEFHKALAEEEMTEDELRRDLKDQLLALKYVDRRIKFFVHVTLDDQKKYYEENKDKFGGKDFADVQGDIEALLTEKETSKKLEEYLTDLRAKTKIQKFK